MFLLLCQNFVVSACFFFSFELDGRKIKYLHNPKESKKKKK